MILSISNSIEIDYVKANKNTKVYEQVPQGVLIWTKFQANEPQQIFSDNLRGRGWLEPLENHSILSLRKAGHEVNVNYLTTAKTLSYLDPAVEGKYEMCGIRTRPFKTYKFMKDKLIKEHSMKRNNYSKLSIPVLILSPVERFAILPDKAHLIQPYLWPGTQIYNVKAILDDTRLKTAVIKSTYTAIKQYIYNDWTTDGNQELKKIYKFRVYEFVASNADQITLMLNGRRMDYAQMDDGNFFMKKYKIPEEKIKFYEYSKVHPNQFTIDDKIIIFYLCNGPDSTILKKRISIINQSLKEVRTNYEFWKKVMDQFHLDTKSPLIDPKETYDLKEHFKLKNQIDQGMFDL